MIICIGPVCIPLWGLLPFLAVWLAPLWNKIKSWLGFEAPPPTSDEADPTARTAATDGPAPGPSEPSGSNQDASQTAAGLRLRRTAQKTPSELIALKDEDHWQSLLASSKENGVPIIIDFGAEWCKPCKRLLPTVQSLATKHEAVFVTVDIEEHEEFALSMSVSAVPTFKCLQGGLVVQTITGPDEAKLQAWVAKSLE
eukprot:m.101795 g.101795  ORF g.101795 m.101795 type:complete len:198 (-) comp15185_c0_seq1:1574-2167(-)